MKIPTQINWLAVTAAFALILSGATTAYSDSIAKSAEALTAQVNATLASLHSFRADFVEIDSYTGEYRDLKQSGTVSLSKPGKLSIFIQRFRRVNSGSQWLPSGNDTQSTSDGTAYWFAFVHPHSTQYKKTASSDAVQRSAVAGVPPVTSFFSSQHGSVLPGQDGPATLEPSSVWEGVSYQVMQYPVAGRGDDNQEATAYVGSDNIVHRLIYRSSDGSSVKEWQLHNVVLNTAITDTTFTYTVPADAFPYDPTVSGPPLQNGSVAPDFAVADRDGKQVRLSNYKGKTVILDFWATWCWPCNESLPHTEKVAEAFAGRNVVVLAVAIRDSKAGFDAWLKKHNYPSINFAIDTEPEGKDVASTLYNVVTTPTAYVIDNDGKVVDSISGYAGPTERLASAVNVALSQTTASAIK